MESEKNEINEKKSVSVAGKKRSLEDAEIDDGMEDVNGAAKKMKLNSGDAAVVDDEDKK